jgi:hypothetical protein
MTTTAPQSARVDVLTAEVRVLQVGSRQVTLSVYRQLDKQQDTDRFEAFGRVRDDKNGPYGLIQLVGRDTQTGALVRHDSEVPDWKPWDGPHQFTHWLRHRPKKQRGRGPYRVAETGTRAVVWTGNGSYTGCSSSYNWHISDTESPLPPWRGDEHSEYAERQRAERCTIDLIELERTWRAAAKDELAEMLGIQAEYDRFKALPLIVLAGLK